MARKSGARARAGEQARSKHKAKVDGNKAEYTTADDEWKGSDYGYPHGEKGGKVIATYIYQDEHGEPYLRVQKTDKKKFPQSHWVEGDKHNTNGKWVKGPPNGPKIPYDLPKLIKTGTDVPVFICEGEKDADSVTDFNPPDLEVLELIGTTNSEGAGKWTTDLNKWFEGRKIVYVLEDNDPPGRKHANMVASNLVEFVGEVRIVRLPGLGDKEDVTDWVTKYGGTKEKLLDLAAEAPLYKPVSFHCNDKGHVVAKNQHNIRTAMTALNINVRYDAFRDRMLIDGLDGHPVLDDVAMNKLWLLIDTRFDFLPPIDFFCVVIQEAARRNAFHPVRDYFDGLVWDGVPRLDQWLIKYGGAQDTEYVRAVGPITLIAAVRRIRQPGCKFDEMLIFESLQGTDKSMMLQTMAVESEWFSDDLPLNADGKRVIEQIRGKWIVEAAELSGMRRADVEHLKAMLSRQVDRGRMAYGRLTMEVERQCVIIGTTNSAIYLRDLTGNRRFWPVKVKAFDIAAIKQDRDQLWAEAAAREAEGASIRLSQKLWNDAAAEQQQRTVNDPWQEDLESLIGDQQGKVRSTDLWNALGVEIEKRTQEQNARLGAAMKALGFERKILKFNGKNERCYVRGTLMEQIINVTRPM